MPSSAFFKIQDFTEQLLRGTDLIRASFSVLRTSDSSILGGVSLDFVDGLRVISEQADFDFDEVNYFVLDPNDTLFGLVRSTSVSPFKLEPFLANAAAFIFYVILDEYGIAL